MKKKFMFFVLISMVVILAGCIKIPLGDGESLQISKDGFTVSDSEGQETTVGIDTDEGKVSVSSDSGEEFSFGVNVDIPDRFPSDIPIPKDAIIVSGITIEDENATSVTYVYEGTFDDVVKLYQQYLSNGNFDTIEDSSSNEDVAATIGMFKEAGREIEMINATRGNEINTFHIQGDEEENKVTVIITHIVGDE